MKEGEVNCPAQRNSKNTFIYILIATVSQNLSLHCLQSLWHFAFNARLNNMDPHTLIMDQCSLQISDL